eukprot:gnl/Chilomastix_caulleri/4688.p1 GENE.gnl/Chilomastix_caulleri/4688~~gnl/Chilomastix_caulleri/4688.p1  ORF type:complete len:99 (-),score=16.75 gnl/Chilomastix_caulleri/4688:18-314(-)
MKKACGGIKACEDVVAANKDIGLASLQMSVDTTLGAYGMASTFNLGAVCLGANPTGYFSGVKPIVTDDILNRLEDLCEGSIDMLHTLSIDMINPDWKT